MMGFMRPIFILDGYNVIGKIERLTRIKDGEGLERSREALAAMLASYAGRRGGREFIIVFDGQASDGSLPSVGRIRGIKCYFTRRGVEADDFIGEMLAATKDRRHVTVISADNKVANKCRVHGAVVSHPSIFCETDKKEPPVPQESSKFIPADKAIDITKWYREKLADSSERR